MRLFQPFIIAADVKSISAYDRYPRVFYEVNIMKLRLLAALSGLPLDAGTLPDVNISSVVFRLEEVTKDCLFICIKGSRYDSHADAPAAREKGAVTVGERDSDGVTVVVPDARKAASMLLSAFYSHPANRMSVVGITGTNGKTTTAHLLRQLACFSKKNCGYIGTLGAFYADKNIVLSHTTPQPQELFSLLADMLHYGTQSVIMEVSSQALHQKRTEGIRFSLGIFLNLTRDHLDYHPSMEAYFRAKSMLFDSCRMALINIDDVYGRRLRASLPRGVIPYTVSMNGKADFTVRAVDLGLDGSRFTVTEEKMGITEEFFVPLIGRMLMFDAAVAVIGAKLALGISFAQAKRYLCKTVPVPGRAQRIEIDAPFCVLCDYAHSPDALKRLFDELNALKGEGRLIALYGCGGDRDSGKRPIMAKIGEKADILILTSDNPRSENPIKILQDMKKGLMNDTKCSIIVNRAEAIACALDTARAGDIVALCGKGHEDYQIVGDKKLPMNEKTIVKETWQRIKDSHDRENGY